MRAVERAPLSPDELARIDADPRAANYLTVGQIYLLDNARLRASARGDRREAAVARALGHEPGPQHPLRASRSGHRSRRPEHDVRDRARATVARRSSRTRGSKVRTRETYPSVTRDAARHAARCSASSRFRAACRATSPPRRPVRSTRAASSATRSATRSAPRSTTRISSSRVWSATVRPRPVRSRRVGTRTSSSTRSATARCLPILHLNGYKIANPAVLARISDAELTDLLRGLRMGCVPRRRRRSRARAPATRGDARSRARGDPRDSAARSRGR